MTVTGSKSLYLQVIAAVIVGILLGHFFPDFAKQLQPLGDAFVKLVKLVIAPIIFLVVAVGIAKLSNTNEVGRIGLKAIVYFEILTTLAMLIGLAVGHFVGPGVGLNADPTTLRAGAAQRYITGPKPTTTEFLLNIIPNTVGEAFTKGDILPVLLFAVLFGVALAKIGARAKPVVTVLDEINSAFFGIVSMIMRVAPLGALGAMAFAIGTYGVGALVQLAWLMGSFYITCVLFVFVVLWGVMAWIGLPLLDLLRYLKEEFLIVLGTSSSEAALPTLMEKLEHAGCAKPLVGLVVPLGYAFNLDGTSIYFTMAIAFISQALNIHLSFSDWVIILSVLLLTSKGAAAITGGGFITLAATLGTLSGKIPVESIVLVLPIDRFMSEARALTNLAGNAVATLFVAKWEGQLDIERARAVLARHESPQIAIAG